MTQYYIDAIMDNAEYKLLSDGTYTGYIYGWDGVVAFAPTYGECIEKLRSELGKLVPAHWMVGESEFDKACAPIRAAFKASGRAAPEIDAVLEEALMEVRAERRSHKEAERTETVKTAVVHYSGYNIPIWRLEMARRAGSSIESLCNAFLGLTPQDLELAFAYAAEHKDIVDQIIKDVFPDNVDLESEAEDMSDEEFDREMYEEVERNADMYRRLAD